MKYLIFLRSGQTYEGHDERFIDEMLTATDDTADAGDLPKGWTWVAGLNVRVGEVVGIAHAPAGEKEDDA